MLKIFILSLLFLLVFLLPVQAQNELTAEEQALLDRMINAKNAMLDYESFVMQIDSDLGFTLHQGQTLLWKDYTMNWHNVAGVTIHAIQGESPNVLYEIESETTIDEALVKPGQFVADNYSNPVAQYSAEVRLVDGAFYFKGDGTISEETSLPIEWTQVEDPADWMLSSWVNDPNDLNDWLLFDENSVPFQNIVSLASVKQTLADGTVVEVITLLSDKANINPIEGNTLDPARTGTTITLTLDENDVIVEYSFRETLFETSSDYPPIETTNFNNIHITISEVNAATEPIETPLME
jgi:hypothetical protein